MNSSALPTKLNVLQIVGYITVVYFGIINSNAAIINVLYAYNIFALLITVFTYNSQVKLDVDLFLSTDEPERSLSFKILINLLSAALCVFYGVELLGFMILIGAAYYVNCYSIVIEKLKNGKE